MDPAADAVPVAAAVPAPELGSVLSLWEGDARLEPACDAPPRRASRGRLAGVRGPGNLHFTWLCKHFRHLHASIQLHTSGGKR